MSKEKMETKTFKKEKNTKYESVIKPQLEKIKHYVSHGVTEAQLCSYYDIGKTQWYKYKKEHSELSELLCNGKKIFQMNLINRAFEVAMGYEYTESTTVEYKDAEGNVTETKIQTHKKYARADAGMIQFLLINRFSDEFARDPQILELRKQSLEQETNKSSAGKEMSNV